MSIFKSTFRPFICRQINARQDLVSIDGNRPIEVQQFTTAKSPWVKMISFVNYDSPDGKYSGDQLARKYVLCGGTLNPNPADDQSFSLRYGVGARNAAYGGNLGNRDYGMMPMPGISSVNIKSKSAYGSLREATVKFYCWDKKQLDELEILFMRPGYTVLLEWGWSLYLDTSVNGETYNVPQGQRKIDLKPLLDTHKLIQPLDYPTINPFDTSLDQDAIYDKIRRLQHKFSGNYDASLAKIMNFSWQLLPNGGFECTTVLISIGDVLDTLKINSVTANKKTDEQDESKNKLYDEFESMIVNLQRLNYTDSIIEKIKQSIPVEQDIDTILQQVDVIPNNGEGAFFIQFAYLVHIINERWNLFNGDQKYIDIEIPVFSSSSMGNGLCIASQNIISIDPGTCTIKNTNATFFNKNGGFDILAGKIPHFNEFAPLQQDFSHRPNPTDRHPQLEMREFLQSGTNLGIIGNIYLNTEMVMNTYRQLIADSNGSIGVGVFLKELLRNASFALGSINDFDIFVIDNKAVIIDKQYTEYGVDAAYDSKYQLNLIGNNAVTRNIHVVSKIFPSQATMIAIAAQSRENVSSIQSSTNVYLNDGIKNRLIERSEEYGEKANEASEIKTQKEQLIDNMRSLIDYVHGYLLTPKDKPVKIPNADQRTRANSYLNSYLLKITTDANYRAIIPVCLDVTLDGIGGFTIGEIFTVNKDALPAEYNNKNIGFIVTGINSDINRSDWKTTLSTQICLLDQDELAKRAQQRAVEKEVEGTIQVSKNIFNTSIQCYNILVAFIKDYYSDIFSIQGSNLTYKGVPQLMATSREQGFDSFQEVLQNFGATISRVRPSGVTLNSSAKNLLNGYIVSKGWGGRTDPRIVFLDTLITNNKYYNLLQPSIKTIFDKKYSELNAAIVKGNGKADNGTFNVDVRLPGINAFSTFGDFVGITSQQHKIGDGYLFNMILPESQATTEGGNLREDIFYKNKLVIKPNLH